MEWEYLFDVFDRFGLGSGFTEWVKLLYRSPVARFLVNVWYFPLALCWWCLAVYYQPRELHTCFNINYPSVWPDFRVQLWQVGGLATRWLWEPGSSYQFPFQVVNLRLYFPGHQSISKYWRIVQTQSVKSDLNRWFDLRLSWMGRISLIKMNVLPRILYPMQMLPLKINITACYSCLSKCIWHGKKSRFKVKTLHIQ